MKLLPLEEILDGVEGLELVDDLLVEGLDLGGELGEVGELLGEHAMVPHLLVEDLLDEHCIHLFLQNIGLFPLPEVLEEALELQLDLLELGEVNLDLQRSLHKILVEDLKDVLQFIALDVLQRVPRDEDLVVELSESGDGLLIGLGEDLHDLVNKVLDLGEVPGLDQV